jgi:hypothetical protein
LLLRRPHLLFLIFILLDFAVLIFTDAAYLLNDLLDTFGGRLLRSGLSAEELQDVARRLLLVVLVSLLGIEAILLIQSCLQDFDLRIALFKLHGVEIFVEEL